MSKTPSITWPKTESAKQKELANQLNKAQSLAEIGSVVEAAKAVKMPVHERVRAAIHEEKSKGDSMPGKSRRRLEKKERRNNNAWDEVNAIALACSQMIAVSSNLSPMLAERELLLHLDDIPLFNRLIQSIVRDTRKLAGDFQKIYKSHEGKNGSIVSDEDLVASYSIFTDYVNFTELANSCLVPSLAHASEMLGEALNRLSVVNPELAARINYDSINYQFNKARSAMAGITGEEISDEPTMQEAVGEIITE